MAALDRRPGIRPRASLGRRLDVASRHAFPASGTVVLMLVTELPFGFVAQTALLPAVAVGCVWFWSLYRPTAMLPAIVFPIGVLLDLLGYLPPGVGVLTLLCTHGAAVRWRRHLVQQGFAVVWLAYLPIAALAAVLGWVLTAALTSRLIPVGPAIFQAALTAAVYPVLAIPLAHAHRGIAAPERA